MYFNFSSRGVQPTFEPPLFAGPPCAVDTRAEGHAMQAFEGFKLDSAGMLGTTTK